MFTEESRNIDTMGKSIDNLYSLYHLLLMYFSRSNLFLS